MGEPGIEDGALASYVDGSWTQTVASSPWVGIDDETSDQKDGAQIALNQLSAFSPSDPGTQMSATLDLMADTAGVLNLSLGTSVEASSLFRFGSASPTSPFTVTIVPEPTTATLLGLGLLGLGALRRRER